MRFLLVLGAPLLILFAAAVIYLILYLFTRIFVRSDRKNGAGGTIITEAREVERPRDGSVQDLDDNGSDTDKGA